MDNEDELSAVDEEQIASLLRVAGRREEVPDHLKQRWSEHFRQELDSVIDRRVQHRKYWFSACASIALVVVASVFLLRQPLTIEPITVLQVVGKGILHSNSSNDSALVSGQNLEAGDTLLTEGSAALSLNYRHFDIRLNADTQLRIDPEHLTLLQGEIYVRSTPHTVAGALTIVTEFATIYDVGTQFLVRLTKHAVISTVREGSILVESGENRSAATVEGNIAQQVTVNSQKDVEITAASGTDWEWIYALSPPFQLEGSSVYEFLLWSVQESGMTLQFADQAAEIYARTTVLHGNVSGLNPSSAVEPILATTHLIADLTTVDVLTIELNR